MSLVAYENSDISSEEEEEEDEEEQGSSLQSYTSESVAQKGDAASEEKISDSNIDADETEGPNFASVLPKPREHTSFFEEDITRRLMFSPGSVTKISSDSINSVGNKSEGCPKTHSSSTSNAKKTVKITLPSLAEFNDEESKPKRLKPSAKGSGLFALLPAPKNLVVKENNRQLIPRVVSKPPPKSSQLVSLPKKVKSETLINYPDSGEESGEENDGTDFFSLTGSTMEIVCPNPAPDLSNEILTVTESGNIVTEVSSSSTCGETLPSASIPIFPQRPSEHDIVTALPEAPAESPEASILQLDEESIHRLCGRRGREEIIDAQVIDVSGETHLPDPKEWLTKQLTEEQETRSHGHRKRDGPTTQQRRKHQITYLAFQAKERELELKNQWAQNKMSRKQTQAKYGF